MSLQLLKASTADALTLVGISKHAFESDVGVGASDLCGPPGYKSLQFYTKMARMNCLYKLIDDDGLTVGGAVLFVKDNEMNVGRIFVAPEHYRKGYGIFMMQQIDTNARLTTDGSCLRLMNSGSMILTTTCHTTSDRKSVV